MLNKSGGGRQDQQLGGGGPLHDGPAFDASDFPSLSAAGGGGQHRSTDGSSETFATLLGNQQKLGLGGQQQQAVAVPSFHEEDFPALPGTAAQPSARQQPAEGSQGAAQLQQLQQQLGSLAEGGASAFGGLGGAGHDLLRMQQQRQLQQQQEAQQKGAAAGGVGAAAGAASPSGGKLGVPDRFGLLGLLSVIRMTGGCCWLAGRQKLVTG
jgi:hypothetical protein